MKLLKIITPLLIFASYIPSYAEEIHDPIHEEIPEISRYPMTISGFIKLDTFWDTRQAVTDDDGDSVLFPLPRRPDVLGRDINARGQFNMLDLETRIRFDIHGPQVGSAMSHAAIEGDFVGNPPILTLFRLRHAYAFLAWDNVTLLAGQFWHPMLVEECSPDLLSADSGNPIAIEARAPQVRATFKKESFETMITLASQIGFVSNGPVGFSSVYARDSMTPNVNLRMQYKKDDDIAGFSLDYKRLRPRLVSNTDFKVNETISSVGATIFGAGKWCDDKITTKVAINVGQNMTNFELLSGYAVHSIDPITDERTYTNLDIFAIWTEWIYTTKWVEPAFFIGWAKNLGASQTVIPTTITPSGLIENLIYALSTNIGTVLQFAPRIRFIFNNFTFGMETEFVRAGYGTILPHGDVRVNDPQDYVRVLFTVFYYF